jgi:hypothetical protein
MTRRCGPSRNADDETGEIALSVIQIAAGDGRRLTGRRLTQRYVQQQKMLPRPLIVATLIGASVGVPYVASHSSIGQKASAPASAAPAATGGAPPTIGVATATAPAVTYIPLTGPTAATAIKNASAGATSASPVDGTRFTAVSQFLRFDVTKEWVCRNWPRKSTGPTDVGLFAIRVPLVMGTQMSALAGSLTYYFNEQGQVEHISFRGRTGDAMPLVQYLTQYYHFQRVQSAVGEQLYQVQESDGVRSELQTQPEGVLKSTAPQQSVTVELEFARPGSKRYLPPHGPTLQIPQVAGSPPAASAEPSAASGSGITSAVKSAAGNYWNQVRYATPDEESPLHWNRWPD